MSKRSASSKIDYYENKIKKLKEWSNKKRSRVIIYSSSSDSEENQDGTMQDETNKTQCPSVLEHCEEASVTIPEAQAEPAQDEDLELDSELLSALGDPMDEQPISASTAASSTRSRFPGNETRSPRYPLGNRGGRRLTRTASSYRRGAMAPDVAPTRARAKPSYSSQRAHTRQ